MRLPNWLNDFIDDYGQAMVSAATVCLFVSGMYVAWKRPPRPVSDRYTYEELVHHSECVSSDSRGVCTSTSEWDTWEPVYVLVSTDDAKCETNSITYFTIHQGDSHKCWQLFGWSGGASDEQVTKLSTGW